jgi:hypothetical protein
LQTRITSGVIELSSRMDVGWGITGLGIPILGLDEVCLTHMASLCISRRSQEAGLDQDQDMNLFPGT